MSNQKLRILFICWGNACRSAMAQYLARKYFGDRCVVDSAGTHRNLPNIQLFQPTIDVMKELGIDMSGHKPKAVECVGNEFDVVINMAPEENSELQKRAPHLASAEWIRWIVLDPGFQSIGVNRSVCLEILKRINTFFKTH